MTMKIRLCRPFLWAVALLASLGTGEDGRASGSERFDLVILNGRIIDPESSLDAVRNLGIRGGEIVAITEDSIRGRCTLDARGMVVAPGFIDLHAHGQQLPAARMQVLDGVTTALELEAGVLPVARYYDRITAEGRPNNYGASVSWAAARYAAFNGIEPVATPFNVAELFKSDAWFHSLASPEQAARIFAGVEQGLREGGLGIGILLGYSPGSGRKEFYALNRMAAAHGVPTFTHVRHGSATEPQSSFEAYQEIIATASATGARMHIAHLNSTSLRDIPLAAEIIARAQRQGLSITVEAYPYGAGSTAIGSALFRGPDWRQRWGGVGYEDVEAGGVPLDEARFHALQEQRPDAAVVIHFLRPERDPRDQEYMDASVLYPGGAIASDGMWWTDGGKLIEGDIWPLPVNAYAHPRSAGTFARLLRVYVRERRKLTLMQAIEKASLIPARILESGVPQMKKKGRIRVGADADLIVFDPETITDRATFEHPAATSQGMRYVIVGGVPVVAEGRLVRQALPGKPIRRSPAGKR